MLSAVHAEKPPLRIAAFQADVTPPLGVPLCHGNVMPAKEIVDPLSARGIILFAEGGPIVLCAVDWTGIGNAANDVWREKLAEAAGTTADRVAVHVCHQHDAPAADYSTEEILAAHDMSGVMFDVAFAEEGLQRVVRAVRDAEPEWLGPFEVFVEVLAGLVGRRGEFSQLIDTIEEEPIS